MWCRKEIFSSICHFQLWRFMSYITLFGSWMLAIQALQSHLGVISLDLGTAERVNKRLWAENRQSKCTQILTRQ